MSDDKPHSGSDISQAKRGAVRVKNLEAIVTSDGDLVVAGTHGTLISWVYGEHHEIRTSRRASPGSRLDQLVNVRWDSYLFIDSDGVSDSDDPRPCTLTCEAGAGDPAIERGIFLCETEVSNLVMV